MKKPVIVRSEAEADLSEAYQWYEQQVRGLGAEFLLCVEAVMASIETNRQQDRAHRWRGAREAHDRSQRRRVCVSIFRGEED
jgi:hypothetical protein